MNHEEYIEKREQLIRDYSDDANNVIDKFSLQFNVVSASLSNYLPGTNAKLHDKIYREILLHQRLSVLEQNCLSAMNFVHCENLDKRLLGLLKNKPVIICTFHTGSYRLINLFLMQQKVPFSLVIAGKVLHQQGDVYRNLFKRIRLDAHDELKLIDAESPAAGLSMLKELKKGKSLVIYIDGNTGSGSANAQNNNRCLINFLDQQIFARKGAAFLSHISNCALITVASYRKSINDIRLSFGEFIYPDASIERNLFAELTTQKIYNDLAHVVASYPEQWEGWLYIHKSANIYLKSSMINVTNTLKPTTNKFIGFNCKEFGIFKIDEASFLLQKSTYKSYPIDGALYDFLSACILQKSDTNNISACLLKQLGEMKIILPA